MDATEVSRRWAEVALQVKSIAERHLGRDVEISGHDASDVVHDVFMKCVQKSEQLRNPEKFEAWARTIAKNHCNDIGRNAQRAKKAIDEATSAENERDEIEAIDCDEFRIYLRGE